MRQRRLSERFVRAAQLSGWKRHTAVLAGLAMSLSASVLAAQAPVITPAGDPSVRNDSIYTLAVDTRALPKDFSKYSYIYLLDDGVSRFEADGRSTRTFRQVAEILTPAAVQEWSERRFSYNPERESLTINWIKVVKPSGEVISEQPTMSQESDVSAPMGVPVYAAQKIRRYSLTGIAPGTLVDISYTMNAKEPYLKGDFYESWNVSMPIPTRRSRFIADMPTSVTPRIIEDHLDFQKRVTEANGRRTYMWARNEVRPPKSELFAPDSSAHIMSLRVAAPIAWSDIGAWYNGLARDRYVLGPVAIAKVDSVVRTAKTRLDTLRALHHWIAHDLRYVAIALGLGGYQPRFPDSTVATGFGDCKDKATLFIAAAKHLGITAYPVLLNAGGVRDRGLPAVEQFNHAIAAIPQAGTPSGYLFTDLTTDAIPPTAIPAPYQDKLMLVVLANGSSTEVLLPKRTASDQGDTRVAAELAPDGKISGHYVATMHGTAGFGFGALAREQPDSAHRATIARMLANMVYQRAKGDSLSLPDTTGDLSDTARVTRLAVRFRDGDGAKSAGSLMLLSLPATFPGQGARFTSILDHLDDPDNENAKQPRLLPIDASKILGETPVVAKLSVRLPEGWKAQLPKNVNAPGPFGTYATEYAQQGRDLTVKRHITGAHGVLPKEQYPALLAWMKAVAADKVDYIVLEPQK